VLAHSHPEGLTGVKVLDLGSVVEIRDLQVPVSQPDGDVRRDLVHGDLLMRLEVNACDADVLVLKLGLERTIVRGGDAGGGGEREGSSG
jgi:hypothetical protein